MRILLQAAFRAKRHFRWIAFSLLTLFGVTVADQLEMVSLGVIINQGVDFFSLFGKGEEVSRKELEEGWTLIDTQDRGVITKEEAQLALSKKKQGDALQHFLDRIKGKLWNGDKRIPKVAIILLAVAIFKALSLFYSRYTTRILAIKISRDLRQQYFDHIQKLSMNFYQKYNIGSLATRVVGDANQIAHSINSLITNYLQTPFTVLTTLCFAFYLSWQLSLVIFVGLPLIVFPVRWITRRVKKTARVLLKNQEGFACVLIDFLAGIQTVKVFSMEAYTSAKYRKKNEETERLESRIACYDLLTRPILHFITTLCLVVVLFFGLYVMHIQLAELVVFCGLLHIFYEPIRKFADENANVLRGVVAAERLFEVLDIQPDITDTPGAVDLTSFEESIEFENVSFQYEEEWVLRNISFTVRKGETVAIIGATGCGKSTILQLIPRLYDPKHGTIRIDGKPLAAYKGDSLRRLISYVPQKPFLFNDTIEENIIYGQKIPQDEIIEAAKKAHAHEFICKLPLQYKTHLAEMGKNLSGGQQQRLAIARALAKKAPVLILDEATSSLDSLSERKIRDSIGELKGKMTQIIVAHRLSTIEHADRIIFIDRGIKTAEGTREELLRTHLPFRAMWEASTLSENYASV